jgi:hypothetical protein
VTVSPTAAAVETAKSNAIAGSADSEPTTTTRITSTNTKYITVKPVATVTGAAAGNNGAITNAVGNCAPVTVTIALSTVTVVSHQSFNI